MFSSKILVHLCMIMHDIVKKKRFFCYRVQAFSTEEILKNRMKDCFKIDSNKIIKMSKKGQYVTFKSLENK